LQVPGPTPILNLAWSHSGVILPRDPLGTGVGSQVIGDPCIVWDETLAPQGGWRMVLFADPPGCGQAICRTPLEVGPGHWKFLGPLSFTNPQAILGGFTHKPFIIQDPQHPNHAARINGQYCLLTVSLLNERKVVQRAWAEHLAGPWTLEPDPIIAPGEPEAFDAKHTDTISGYYFAERREVLYTYKGYPLQPQPWPTSPYGAARAAAVERVESGIVAKLGVILPPCPSPGHWASGWVGGLQVLPGASVGAAHRWVGILNASPTAPDPANTAIWRDEPAPSLGGFAWSDEEWPVAGWQWALEPIEWIETLPPEALAAGEGVNLWRHHLLVLPDGRLALFYNSGPYGREQLYLKLAER
jgi:hypothetical protein